MSCVVLLKPSLRRCQLRAVFSLFLALLLGGCVVFLDHPDAESVQGVVVRSGNGKPVPNAKVVIWEGRRFLALFPMSYPPAAEATTDANGVFSMSVVNRWPARITASAGRLWGFVEPDHAGVRAVTVSLTEKKQGCQ